MAISCETVTFESLKPARTAEEYALHVAALEWSLSDPIVINGKDDIKSQGKWQEGFEPYRHQVENLIRFCRMLPVTLLADDVGLGKTISAGLILSELRERKRVNRCLVVCPQLLGQQWVEELGSKFGIPGVFAKGKDLDAAIANSSLQVVTTTYQTVSSRIDTIRSDQFDMLILDEAHKLRNLHGTPKSPDMAQRIRAALGARKFKYVLMLTATPIQNRVWDLYSLIDLLTVAKGHRNPLGEPGEFRARYIADSAGRKVNPMTAGEFRAILREYVVRTRREDAQLVFPDRSVNTRRLPRGDVENRMTELVADEIQGLNAFAQISMSQAMMSSPQALASQLENMARNGTVSYGVASEARQLADASPRSAKLEGLLVLIRHLRTEREDWRLVVFTCRKETQEAIGRALEAEGISVGFIRGGSASGNQSTVNRFRSDPPKVNVIISTDAGAEGVNLQAGNVLVNYDLPWNPMVMEQRIGRIQRLASVHSNVNVINLVIANSVEERVVGRLMEKLQAVSETIGDIETIIESTESDDEDSFEEMIRKLVIKSLIGQDVEQATRAKTQSIEQAKARMNEERATINQVFGSESTDPQPTARPPKFEPAIPSIQYDQFAMRALRAEGATLHIKPDDVIEVSRPGTATERITFKPEVAERDASGIFMGNAPKVCVPGRPYFERLVQRWLQRSAHALRDFSLLVDVHSAETAGAWCESIPDAKFDTLSISKSSRRITGKVLCKAKAANGVDTLEKLLIVETPPEEHDAAVASRSDEVPTVDVRVEADEAIDGIERVIRLSVSGERDLGAFCKFYESRRQEEMVRAGGDDRRRHKIETDFSPRVFAEVVAMSGLRYERVTADVTFVLDGDHEYVGEIEMIPAARKVIAEPARATCCVTTRELPLPCLGKCDVSGQLATAHLLVKSSASRRKALPEFAVKCGVTGAVVLRDETLTSDYSGQLAAANLFVTSPASGRRGLEGEFEPCEVTGVDVLRDELVPSGVSGKRFRNDQAATSPISGKVGHETEFLRCHASGDPVLPDEVGTSDVSGKVVRRDLLLASEKPPHRVGIREEREVCSVSGKTLLIDEGERSAVSGQFVSSELVTHSDLSGKPALPVELVMCEVSGKQLLPDETEVSAVSGKRANRDLFVTSAMSGLKALAQECQECEMTGEVVLPAELARSDQSGKMFRKDQLAVSQESGRAGHVSEMVVCTGTGQAILLDESDVSAISGKAYSRSLLKASQKAPTRLGIEDECVECAVSGKRLLKDEAVASSVSGQWVDLDLVARSELSGLPALPEELVRCDVSGASLLPSETKISDVSGMRARSDLMRYSEVSGRGGAESESGYCPYSKKLLLIDEMFKSDVSGQTFALSGLTKSIESGRVGHRCEMVDCCVRRGPIFPDEAGVSDVSGKTCCKSLLFESEKSPGRYGLAEEMKVCAATDKRMLETEVVKSAASGKSFDRDLTEVSARSGLRAWSAEMVVCELTGARLLPTETDVCGITGKYVDSALLAKSAISGRVGIRTMMATCIASGRRALPDELQPCEVTGKRVDPAELERCSVSGKTAINRLFIRSDISGAPLLVNLAVVSPASKRSCMPSEALLCHWAGVQYPRDEIAVCKLTGLTFARDLINADSEMKVLRGLLNGADAGADAGDLASWLPDVIGATSGIKAVRCVFCPNGSARAVCAESRSMLGLKVRYAGLFVGEDGTRRLLGRSVVGKRSANVWTAEK